MKMTSTWWTQGNYGNDYDTDDENGGDDDDDDDVEDDDNDFDWSEILDDVIVCILVY